MVNEQTFVMGIIGGTLSAALMNVVPALSVVLILVVADFGFAIWKCFKVGEKIESHKMRKSVTKTIAYLSLIVLGSLIDVAISPDWKLATFIAGFCSVTELISIIESLSMITGKDYLGNLKDIMQNFLNSRKPKA